MEPVNVDYLSKISRTPYMYVLNPEVSRYDPRQDIVLINISSPPSVKVHEFSHAYFFKMDAISRSAPPSIPPDTYLYWEMRLRQTPYKYRRHYKVISHILIDANNTRRFMTVVPEYSGYLAEYLTEKHRITRNIQDKIMKLIVDIALGGKPVKPETAVEKTIVEIVSQAVTGTVYDCVDATLRILTMIPNVLAEITPYTPSPVDFSGSTARGHEEAGGTRLKVENEVQIAPHRPDMEEVLLIVSDYIPKIKPKPETLGELPGVISRKTIIEENRIYGYFSITSLLTHRPRFFPFLGVEEKREKPHVVVLLDVSDSMKKYYEYAVNFVAKLYVSGIADKIYGYQTCEDERTARHILYKIDPRRGFPPTGCRNADSIFIEYIGRQLPSGSRLIVVMDGIPNSSIYRTREDAVKQTRRAVEKLWSRGIWVYGVYVTGSASPRRMGLEQLQEIYGDRGILVMNNARRVLEKILAGYTG